VALSENYTQADYFPPAITSPAAFAALLEQSARLSTSARPAQDHQLKLYPTLASVRFAAKSRHFFCQGGGLLRQEWSHAVIAALSTACIEPVRPLKAQKGRPEEPVRRNAR
jgi:hypothetical protein